MKNRWKVVSLAFVITFIFYVGSCSYKSHKKDYKECLMHYDTFICDNSNFDWKAYKKCVDHFKNEKYCYSTLSHNKAIEDAGDSAMSGAVLGGAIASSSRR